jgi:hypothetical protein
VKHSEFTSFETFGVSHEDHDHREGWRRTGTGPVRATENGTITGRIAKSFDRSILLQKKDHRSMTGYSCGREADGFGAILRLRPRQSRPCGTRCCVGRFKLLVLMGGVALVASKLGHGSPSPRFYWLESWLGSSNIRSARVALGTSPLHLRARPLRVCVVLVAPVRCVPTLEVAHWGMRFH